MHGDLSLDRPTLAQPLFLPGPLTAGTQVANATALVQCYMLISWPGIIQYWCSLLGRLYSMKDNADVKAT